MKQITILFAFALMAIGMTGQNFAKKSQNSNVNDENRYYMGFEDKKQLKEWKEYRIATKEGAGWSVNPRLSHDYLPGYANLKNKKADDWYVSPKFEIKQDAKIDTIKYKSTGMMPRILEGDTIGIYLLRGNQDPTKAKERILLLDVRGENYPYMKSEYTIKTNIELAPSKEPSYIAFRYKNDVIDQRWYTLYFDDLWLSGVKASSGMSNIELDNEHIDVYPNVINLHGLNGISSISLYSMAGNLVYSAHNVNGEHSIEIADLADGIYVLEVASSNQKLQKKIVKQ